MTPWPVSWLSGPLSVSSKLACGSVRAILISQTPDYCCSRVAEVVNGKARFQIDVPFSTPRPTLLSTGNKCSGASIPDHGQFARSMQLRPWKSTGRSTTIVLLPRLPFGGNKKTLYVVMLSHRRSRRMTIRKRRATGTTRLWRP